MHREGRNEDHVHYAHNAIGEKEVLGRVNAHDDC